VEPLDDDDDDGQDSVSVARMLLKKASLGNSAVEKLAGMGVSLQEIEWTSMQMTGNADERMPALARNSTLPQTNTFAWSLFSTGKRYKGHLGYEDDILGILPLVGVRVTGGYSYYWREAHTDENGNFKIPEKWNFSINYEANFDADDFLLEDGHSWYGEDLEIENNDRKSDWNENFYGNKAKWCVVWTAAYQYWYGNNFGLKRPRQNTATNWSLDIEVYYKNSSDYYDENTESSVGSFDQTLGLDDIGILAYKKTSNEIYGTTIHEVAHSSHYWNMKTTSTGLPQSAEFALLSKTYKDTYARGIENYFLEKRYNKMGGEYRRRDYTSQYTGLVEDLIDVNKVSVCNPNFKELVSGFSITSIETAFFKNKKFSTMKNYLKDNNPSGKNGVKYTSSDLDNLFKCWGL